MFSLNCCFLKFSRSLFFLLIMSNFAKLFFGKFHHLKVTLVIFLFIDMFFFLLSNFRISLSTLQEHNWKEETGALSFTFLLIYIMFWWLVQFLLIPWRKSMLPVCLVSISKSFWDTLKTINLQINISSQHNINVVTVMVIKIFKKIIILVFFICFALFLFFLREFNFANGHCMFVHFVVRSFF